jgi:signal transduction histidine kinase
MQSLAKLARIHSSAKQYENGARFVRWACLFLVLVTYPFSSGSGVAIIALLIFTTSYNLLRYSRRLRRFELVNSRINELAVDHFMIICLVVLSGGLSSPYYPFMLLLMMAMIASFGIAGFAVGLAVQGLFLISVYDNSSPISPPDSHTQLIIRLGFLMLFSLVAEQSIVSHDEEHLLETIETRRVSRDRERLLTLVNSIADPVVAVDSKGKVTLYNGATLAILNTNHITPGITFDELIPLRTVAGKRLAFMRLVSSKTSSVRNDLILGTPETGKINIELTVSPVQPIVGRLRPTDGYILVLRDITRQRSIEEERDEFISVASHELRTPVAIAEANISTVLLPGFSKLDAKALSILNQTHDNLVALGELVQDLTTLSHAERGDMKPELAIIDLGSLVAELWRDYKPTAEAKQLTCVFTAPDTAVSAVSSEHEIREILQNFITNAIKYTEKGSVTLALGRTPDGSVYVTVTDTGIGIGSSDQGHLFNKFYRSEDFRTRKTSGTGLGLYIARKLADRIGAVIELESKLNNGSTFRLLLPPTSLPEDD